MTEFEAPPPHPLRMRSTVVKRTTRSAIRTFIDTPFSSSLGDLGRVSLSSTHGLVTSRTGMCDFHPYKARGRPNADRLSNKCKRGECVTGSAGSRLIRVGECVRCSKPLKRLCPSRWGSRGQEGDAFSGLTVPNHPYHAPQDKVTRASSLLTSWLRRRTSPATHNSESDGTLILTLLVIAVVRGQAGTGESGLLVVGAMAVAGQDRVDRNIGFSKYKIVSRHRGAPNETLFAVTASAQMEDGRRVSLDVVWLTERCTARQEGVRDLGIRRMKL